MPSAASPTISLSGSLVIRVRNPLRTMAWSSTIRRRMGSLMRSSPGWNLDTHACPATAGGVNGQHTAHLSGAFLHIKQAQSRTALAAGLGLVKALAVIRNLQSEGGLI